MPDISADLIYTGALSNTGKNLELRDNQGNLIDQVDCSEGWFGGDNATKQTMERKNPQTSGNDSTNWQTSQSAGGTPKAQNSSGQEIIPEESEEPEETEEKLDAEGWIPPTIVNHPPIAQAGPDITALANQEIIFDAIQSTDPDNDSLTFFWNFGDGATETGGKASHTYPYPGQYLVSLLVSDGEFSDLDISMVNIYSQSIIISEFMPDPEGSDTENEWIELFNQSDQTANLTGWQLDDAGEGSHLFIFPQNSLIAPQQFLVLTRPITKLSLNNDQDQVRLFYPDGSLASQVNYSGEKREGLAIAFDSQDYFWTKIPTPGSANIITSTNLEEKNKNISSNNPQPVIEETQEPPEILAKINLSQGQNFNAFEQANAPEQNLINQEIPSPAKTISVSQPIQFEEENSQPTAQFSDNQSIQAAISSAKSSQSKQRANLILTLSIIISGSLVASWLIILLSKKNKYKKSS